MLVAVLTMVVTVFITIVVKLIGTVAVVLVWR